MKKKLIAALTSAAMVATMVPATAFAASPSTTKSEQPAAVVAAEEESAAVTAFKDAVEKIPAKGEEGYDYTAEYKDLLDAATSAYNALSAGDKAVADSSDEKNTYDAAVNKYEGWEQAVNELIAAINELPNTLGNSTEGDVVNYRDVYNGSDSPVRKAAQAYNSLETEGQKDSITNIAKLHALADSSTGAIATSANSMVMYKALGALVKVPNIDGSNYDTSTELQTARDAVKDLTSAQMGMIAQDLKGKYQKAVQTAKQAEELIEAYNKTTGDIYEEYGSADEKTIAENLAEVEAMYKAAEEAFEALGKISNLKTASIDSDFNTNVAPIGKKINDVKESATASEEAQPVLDRIAALPKASEIEDMSKYDEMNSIYEAYNKLTPAAKKAVEDSERASEFNAVAAKIATVYNNLTAEEQAARAKAALAQLPSDDYKVNQTAQTEYAMATGSTEEVPFIGIGTQDPANYVGKATTPSEYFTPNEIDKAGKIASDLKAAYQAEVDAIKELIKDLDADKIEDMDASAFATAKATIDQAEAAVDSLSPEATAVYKTDAATKTKVDNLIAARDTYLGTAAADGLKARMEQLPVAANITAENLATYKPVVEALRADYDAFEGDVENGVYGTYTNPFGSGDYATALDYLEAAEAQIATLELGQDAAKVDEAIEALTILDADKTYTAEELLAAQAAIATVREAYDNLSAEEAGEVTKYAKLVEAEKAVEAASEKTINTEAEKIGAVGLTLTDAQIQQYKVVYDLLSALEKDTSATTTDITDPGKGYYADAIAKLNVMYPNAKAVDTQLAALDENTSSAADILAAREAYDALSDIEKTLVSQGALDKLLAVEKDGKYSNKLLSKATVAAIADQEYTGDQIRPTVTVTSADKKTLKEGTDYTVTYNNNVLVGTATVTITGTGDYAGTITAAFDIVGISINDATVTVANQQTYTGSALTPVVTVKVDGKELTTADYDVAYSNNTNVGTATVTITGKGNYAGTATAKFEIVKANIQNASVTGVANRYYTGKARTQTDLRVYIAGKVLSTDNYSVVYTNNKNIGQASLTITGKGNYTGTITKTFIVKPRKVASVKVTKGKKRVTVRYKKQNGARYQIYYKKAGTKAKTVKTAAVKRTIKKLKSGKTYTIKVRAYKKIGSKTYYGKYSKAKKVRVR